MGNNARSTVGTATGVTSLLHILYSRFGEPRVFPASAMFFNDPAGMCPACEGLGRASTVDVDALLDRDRSLDEDPIRFPHFAVDSDPARVTTGAGSSSPAPRPTCCTPTAR